MALSTTKFDIQDYLKTSEARAAYLAEAFEEGDSELIRQAIKDICQAVGMTQSAPTDSPSST